MTEHTSGTSNPKTANEQTKASEKKNTMAQKTCDHYGSHGCTNMVDSDKELCKDCADGNCG
jgi:hypothetical protein